MQGEQMDATTSTYTHTMASIPRIKMNARPFILHAILPLWSLINTVNKRILVIPSNPWHMKPDLTMPYE